LRARSFYTVTKPTHLGISISPTDGSNADSLPKSADMAMYRAKQAGRNTYRFFLPEMNARPAELL
jgi:GGDEF domain-containing protein